MPKKSAKTAYRTLREFVDSYPRAVKQGEIADILGLSDAVLSSYLGGHSIPGRDTALRLHRDFDIDLEGLLDPPRPVDK